MEVLTIVLIVLFCIDIAISAVNGVLDGKHESELNYRLRRMELLLDRERRESVFPEYTYDRKAEGFAIAASIATKATRFAAWTANRWKISTAPTARVT